LVSSASASVSGGVDGSSNSKDWQDEVPRAVLAVRDPRQAAPAATFSLNGDLSCSTPDHVPSLTQHHTPDHVPSLTQHHTFVIGL
jgi:hypothetical protein